ncbi:hypothetical protein FDENT_11398 [Fusarium denticulatum]|uniref:Uncharacterized protein n=1 Tax=Fusarium denticulatum TaxID=48507 RepID=A0A8H5TID2_9HYPO|nr:hypothetical protein FDENT_11398 [Fusarium denticulatum]
MPKSCFETITSQHAYESHIQSNPLVNPFSFSDLQTRASSWGRRQLLTCHVIVSSTRGTLLPAYETKQITHFPDKSRIQIDNFIQGPGPDFIHQCEHSLVHEYGVALGQVWAALGAVKRPRASVTDADDIKDAIPTSSSNQGTPPSKRLRRNTHHEGFVNSDSYQINSSSPSSKLPGGTPDSSVGYVDKVLQEDLPVEDNAVRLISCIKRHILYYIQLPGSTTVVEVRDIRQRMDLEIPGLSAGVIAVDDGGLYLKAKDEEGHFVITRSMVALFEAKRSLNVVDGKPVISDECLAQMTCEAILARATDLFDEFPSTSVTIINATQKYVCFLQYDVEDSYIEDLKLGVAPSQPLIVTATQWFDLSSSIEA